MTITTSVGGDDRSARASIATALDDTLVVEAAAGTGKTTELVNRILAVLATGPLLTNAYDGVDGVERDVTDAARGMGMSALQILARVELPLALPLLFTGIRVAAVTVVATAPIAAIAGGGGLGDIIVNQASYRLEGVLGACYCVMALSTGVWLVLLALQRTITPRPLRAQREPPALGSTASPRKESFL